MCRYCVKDEQFVIECCLKVLREKNAISYFFNGNKGYFVLYTPPWLHEERDLVFIFIQTWRTYAVTLDHFPVAMFYTCLMTDKLSRNEYC